jgi:hypothetical protein
MLLVDLRVARKGKVKAGAARRLVVGPQAATIKLPTGRLKIAGMQPLRSLAE